MNPAPPSQLINVPQIGGCRVELDNFDKTKKLVLEGCHFIGGGELKLSIAASGEALVKGADDRCMLEIDIDCGALQRALRIFHDAPPPSGRIQGGVRKPV